MDVLWQEGEELPGGCYDCLVLWIVLVSEVATRWGLSEMDVCWQEDCCLLLALSIISGIKRRLNMACLVLWIVLVSGVATRWGLSEMDVCWQEDCCLLLALSIISGMKRRLNMACLVLWIVLVSRVATRWGLSEMYIRWQEAGVLAGACYDCCFLLALSIISGIKRRLNMACLVLWL